MIFDLGESTDHDAFVKISDLLRPHGYAILNHNAQYTWFTFVNHSDGILAEVRVNGHDQVEVRLKIMYRIMITVQTPWFQIDHPRFKNLFEARIIEVMGFSEYNGS